DLSEHLGLVLQIGQSRGLTRENYEQVATQFGGTVTAFENTVRKGLLAARFIELCAYAGATPTKEGIEALWNEEHEERAFDYGEVATADFADAAKGELPDDAALEAWLTAQGPAESRAFELAERRSLDMASFRDAATTPAAALLAAFPPKEG